MRILASDCGSTTTKIILIEEIEGHYRLAARGEAPTTVEAPVEDVTQGVRNAILELEELTGIPFLEDGKLIKPASGERGADCYVSTSSAGGGLQMTVGGVVREISGESASRAALGAGAIVMDVVATNDGRLPHERIERLRELRPDMILLSGGMDGGTISHVAEIAELIAASDPKPRLGVGKLPVIFAGNRDAQPQVKEILDKKVDLEITENLRPSDKTENLQPARGKIQALFLEHVMAHAPGYKNLMSWTDLPIMPTPAAVGLMMQRVAQSHNINILGVDIGGATTDVFSVFHEIFNRSVSANLGMSYSISNVFLEAGLQNILRWVPFDLDVRQLRNRIKNKMIRPTTIPQELPDLILEQAVCREALRLSLIQHKLLAVGLKGIQKERTIADAFLQTDAEESLVNMKELDMIIGSGGVLSHAPRRAQAAMMMIDAFLPEGVTALTVDSIFMMPQLGVLSQAYPQAAEEVFERDCLVWLGTVLAPVGETKPGKKLAKISIGDREEVELVYGELKVVPLEGKTRVRIQPVHGIDAGKGRGESFETEIQGGTVGFILDGRGRPFKHPSDPKTRIEKLNEWNQALSVYPHG